MELTEFAKQVQLMRQYQSEYFANRTPTNLFNSKQQERYVDSLTEGILNPDAPINQLNMFKIQGLSVRFEELPAEITTLHNELVRIYENGDVSGAYGMIYAGDLEQELFMPIVAIHQGANRGKRFILTNDEVKNFIIRLL